MVPYGYVPLTVVKQSGEGWTCWVSNTHTHDLFVGSAFKLVALQSSWLYLVTFSVSSSIFQGLELIFSILTCDQVSKLFPLSYRLIVCAKTPTAPDTEAETL